MAKTKEDSVRIVCFVEPDFHHKCKVKAAQQGVSFQAAIYGFLQHWVAGVVTMPGPPKSPPEDTVESFRRLSARARAGDDDAVRTLGEIRRTLELEEQIAQQAPKQKAPSVPQKKQPKRRAGRR